MKTLRPTFPERELPLTFTVVNRDSPLTSITPLNLFPLMSTFTSDVRSVRKEIEPLKLLLCKSKTVMSDLNLQTGPAKFQREFTESEEKFRGNFVENSP